MILISLTLPGPVRMVKGLLVDTGVSPTANDSYLSIDAGRVAFLATGGIGVYDIASQSSAIISSPNGPCAGPSISDDKIVAACGSNFNPTTLYSCTLPHTTPLQPCGPWTAVVSGLPSIQKLTYTVESSPQVSGDLVVYGLINAFGYYRFSSGINTTVTLSYQPHTLSSNGAIIAFAGGTPETIKYYDTSVALGSRHIVDTGLPGEYASLSQYTIAFNDLTTTPERVRYFDILRNQSSSAGTGPVGNMTFRSSPSIWGNRIVFEISEVADGYDCNGDGTISSAQYCIGYWNIRYPGYAATTLAPSAAPAVTNNGGGGSTVIYDNTIAFIGQNFHIQYVTVPMKGDVNLDGIVDSNDQGIVNGCLGQLLKGTMC